MNNRIWRLLITLLLITLVDLLGWYASDKFLQWLQDAKPGEIFERPIVIVLYRIVFLAGGILVGFLLGRFVFKRLESVGDRLRDMSGRDKISLGIGLAVGLILTSLLSLPLLQAISSKPLAGAISLVIGGVITYLTTAAALSMKEEIRFYMPPQQPEEEQLPKEKFKILDTNVIIDGRIADVARAGFLDGAIYIPGFVLDELQHIADSADGLKRARGRRGLDILNAMQKELTLMVRTYDRLVPGNEEVDARLVKLARALDGALVTNDFNLAKVAELQGVQVLNVNELANALKPIVLPGEILTVALVKEGREPSQAVGYLDDGTMIVVEGGRRHMGETVDVAVSSLLQTTAGKMIFAHLTDDEGDDDYGRNVRPYTGGGPRRPVRRRE